MVSMSDLLHGKKLEEQSIEIQDNLKDLLEKINSLLQFYGQNVAITSGLRTKEDQIRIYAQKGITDMHKIPMRSQHLIGAAVDIYDSKFELTNWCRENIPLLISIGLWCEDDKSAPRLHLQIYPPKSGSRFFKA